MRAIYKTFFTILGIAAVLSVLAPIFVSAQASKPSLCSKLTDFVSKFEQKVIGHESKLETKRTDILNRITAKRDERNTKLAGNRTKWDDNRNEHYAKLEERAQTDVQKQAVDTFKVAIEAAVAKRRAAVDAAIQSSRQQTDLLIASRKSSVDGAVNAFKAAVDAAIKIAELDCAGSTDSKTVRQTLISSLKAAQEKFKTDRQAIDKLGPIISQMTTTRNQAIQKAFDDFKAELEAAKTALKAVFPEE